MIAELIRDNRKIVDRITQDQIELFVGLLKINKVAFTLRYVTLRYVRTHLSIAFTATNALLQYNDPVSYQH